MPRDIDSDILHIPQSPRRPAGTERPPSRSPARPKPVRQVPLQPAKQTTPRRSAAGDAETDDEGDGHALHRRSAAGEIPAWVVSMLVHMTALMVMALVVSEAANVTRPMVITATPSDAEPEPDPVEIPKIDDVPEPEEVSEPVPEVVVASDVAIEPIDRLAISDQFDTAPPDGTLVDFSEQTAPAAGLMSSMGIAGSTPGGLAARRGGKKIGMPGVCSAGESAVDRSLKWIAIHQLPDGGWSFDLAACPSCMGTCSHSGTSKKDDRAGATALALLPFLGRGYTHREGPYKKQVEGGIAFLVDRAMKNNGKVYDGSGSLYSQGLAGIALSECYAMSQDARLAAPTQAVLNFIMTAQDPRGGGWRYRPGQSGDTSAVGWQIMALKSGNMAYLQVNPLTIKKAVEFLDSVESDYGAAYGYTDAGSPTLPRSSVGLLCRMYLGWKKDHEGLQEGARRIAKAGPSKDLYYDYYATQIMHHMEGETWLAWDAKMKKMLLDSQATKDHEAGSWHAGVDGGHGAHAAGRLYCTSLATMILEVYYRHLPIYQNQSFEEEFRE